MRTEKYINTYSVATFIVAILFALMQYIHPKLMDDCWFENGMHSFLANPGFKSFFKDSFEALVFRLNFDNGRIPNIFGSPIIMIPKIILSLGIGAAFAFSIYWSARITMTWKNNLLAFGIIIAGFVFFLPWYDSMFVTMFALNYVVPSFFLIFCSYLILNLKIRSSAACFFLALFVGMWHEAFAAAAIGGITALLICFRKYRHKQIFFWLAGFYIAVIYLLLVPATSYKGGGIITIATFFNLKLGFTLGFPFYFYSAAILLLLAIKKTRGHFFTPTQAYIFGAALSAFVVWRTFMGGYRTSWVMLLMSIIGFADIVAKLTKTNHLSKINKFLAYLLIICAILQPCLSFPWFLKMNQEHKEATQIAKSLSEGETAFYGITTETSAPLYTLNRPNFGLYGAFGFPHDKVFPIELKDFSPDKADSINSNHIAYLYKKLLVVENFTFDDNHIDCFIYFDNKPYLTRVRLFPFTNSYGTFLYAQTEHTFDKNHLHKITGINLYPTSATKERIPAENADIAPDGPYHNLQLAFARMPKIL